MPYPKCLSDHKHGRALFDLQSPAARSGCNGRRVNESLAYKQIDANAERYRFIQTKEMHILCTVESENSNSEERAELHGNGASPIRYDSFQEAGCDRRKVL